MGVNAVSAVNIISVVNVVSVVVVEVLVCVMRKDEEDAKAYLYTMG